MPNRMLRDWTDSDTVNALSVYGERFFVRLIMKADDFGCYHADARLLKSFLFPLLPDGVREADISRWTAECEKAGLIVLYESDGKRYLQIQDFRQRLDKARNKFPLPGSGNSITVVNGFQGELERKPKGKEESSAHADLSKSNLYRQPNIPAFELVKAVFAGQGGTEEMATKFFDEYEATNWFRKGSPITNFVTLVPGFVANWKRNLKKENPVAAGPSAADAIHAARKKQAS